MLLPQLTDLELVGVFDRGVPNMERIVIRAKARTQMEQYGIILAWHPFGGSAPAQPYNDFFYWFGEGILEANDTLFVFTGTGEPKKTTVLETGGPAYVVHWGKTTTLLADSRIVPVIVRFGQIQVGNPARDVPQNRLLTQGRPTNE